MTHMLNSWWKAQKQKPLVKPTRIRHIVEMAVQAGWSLNECYDALGITWAFTESAFETALRRQKDENDDKFGKLGKRILKLRKERMNGESKQNPESGL